MSVKKVKNTKEKTVKAKTVTVHTEPIGIEYSLIIEGEFCDTWASELTAEELKRFGQEFLEWCSDGDMVAVGAVKVTVRPK